MNDVEILKTVDEWWSVINKKAMYLSEIINCGEKKKGTIPFVLIQSLLFKGASLVSYNGRFKVAHFFK